MKDSYEYDDKFSKLGKELSEIKKNYYENAIKFDKNSENSIAF